jgi:hypothetical protein
LCRVGGSSRGGIVCTSHPGVLGSIPKREEPRKTGLHPVLKHRVPHGSQQPCPGWAPDPLMVGIRSPDGENRVPPCVKVPGTHGPQGVFFDKHCGRHARAARCGAAPLPTTRVCVCAHGRGPTGRQWRALTSTREVALLYTPVSPAFTSE